MNKLRNTKKNQHFRVLDLAVSCVVLLIAVIACGVIVFSNISKKIYHTVSSHTVVERSNSIDGFVINFNHNPALNVVTIDLYEDPLCPICGAFERSSSGKELYKLIRMGKVKANYHLVNFLDGISASKHYSSLVVGALDLIYKSDFPNSDRKQLWLAIHKRLFDQDIQPEEGGISDLSQAQLLKIVQQVADSLKIVIPIAVNNALQGDIVTLGRHIGKIQLGEMLDKSITGVPTLIKNNSITLNLDILTPADLDKLALN